MDRIKRRQFVCSMAGVGLAGAGLGLLAGCRTPPPGRSSAQVPRLGVLIPNFAEQARDSSLEPLRRGLRDLGHVEGQNVLIDLRFAEGSYDRLPELVAELLGLDPAVLVVGSPPAVQAAQRATSTTPIVMVGGGDPVAAGFVASLARPGGNITGLATQPVELTDAKRLHLLSEVVPGLSRVATLRAAGIRVADPNALEVAAQRLGLAHQFVDVRGPDEIEGAIEAALTWQAEALVVAINPMLVAHYTTIAAVALRHRLPTISGFRQFVLADGLMSYGSSSPDLWRRTAYYADRILKGTKPADLPVEQPMTFDFVINRRTLEALGLHPLPYHVALQVTEVIE